MTLAMPFTQPLALKRLAQLYLVAFWFGAFAFYVTLFREGTDAGVALLAFVSAATACLLLRIADRSEAVLAGASVEGETRLLAEPDLLVSLKQMLNASKTAAGQVGVMVVAIHTSNANQQEPLPAPLMNLVRGELFRNADSRIFDLDRRTLAVTAHNEAALAHFEQMSRELLSEFGVRRPTAPWSTTARLTVGVAVTENRRLPATNLLANAKAAVEMAEGHGRDCFFRQV